MNGLREKELSADQEQTLLGNFAALYPSLQGEGPLVGQPHLFLRLVGCNMRCQYCDAPETLKPKEFLDVGAPPQQHLNNPVHLGELIPLMKEQALGQNLKAIAITGGEPLLQTPLLLELLPRIKAEFSLPILLETNGLLPKQFAKVKDFIDILSADLKLVSVDQSAPQNDRVKTLMETLSHTRPGAQVYIKVVTSEHTDLAELRAAAQQIGPAFPQVEWFVQALTREGKPLEHPILLEALSLLESLGIQAKLQPQWHVQKGLP